MCSKSVGSRPRKRACSHAWLPLSPSCLRAQYLLDTNSKLRKQLKAEHNTDAPPRSAAFAAHAAYKHAAAQAIQAGEAARAPPDASPYSSPPPPPPPRNSARKSSTKLKAARPPQRQFSAWLSARKDNDKDKPALQPSPRAEEQLPPSARPEPQQLMTPSRPAHPATPGASPRTVEELLPNEESAAKLVQRVGALTAEDISRLPPAQRETVLQLRKDLGLG